MRSDIWRRRSGSANSLSFLGREVCQRAPYEAAMFEKSSTKKGLEIRLRAAHGPEKIADFIDTLRKEQS